jgi:hypothetical protein
MKFFPHQLRRAATAWFGSPQSIARGMPAPLGPEEKRPAAAMQHLAPFGVWRYDPPLPYYSRGAAAYTGTSGTLLYDPVGQGWIVTKRCDYPMRKTADYLNGAIFWNTTPQNLGRQPFFGMLYTPRQLASLYGYSTASAIVAVPNAAAPGGLPPR